MSLLYSLNSFDDPGVTLTRIKKENLKDNYIVILPGKGRACPGLFRCEVER